MIGEYLRLPEIQGIVRSLVGDDPLFDHDFVHRLPAGSGYTQHLHVDAVVDELRERVTIPVETWDERLSSVQASHSTPSLGRRKSARTSGAGRDAAAAAIVLQAYLDSRRAPVR